MGAPLHADRQRAARRHHRLRRQRGLRRRALWLADGDYPIQRPSAAWVALQTASLRAAQGLRAGGNARRIWRRLRRLVWSWLRREPGHPWDTTTARARDLVRDELAEDTLAGWVWHCSDRWNLSRLRVADALFERDHT